MSSRCFGVNFLVTAQGLGYAEQDAKRLWRRLVSQVRGAEHTVHSAFQEQLTIGELWNIRNAGKDQFRNMSDEDWTMVLDVIKELLP